MGHLESYTPGTSWHVSTYRYVPTCTDLYYDIVCTGTYYLRNVAKRYRSVHTGTYQYKKMSKSTYAYVLNCVQSGTGQYRAVQGSTRNGTRQYRSKYNKVQGSTWRYMSVHGLHLRRAAGRGGGRFWCAFQIAALTAPTVASASSHCMHKLVYSSLGALARASPAWACQCYGPPLCHLRAAAAAAAAGDAEAGSSPAPAAAAGGGVTS